MEAPQIKTIEEAVSEIMKIYRSLPPRPSIEDLEASHALITNVDSETKLKLDAISRQKPGNQSIPSELFTVLQQMQTRFAQLHSDELKRDALRLLDLENVHLVFDDLVRRASDCVSGSSGASSSLSSVSSSVINSYGSNSNNFSGNSTSGYDEKEGNFGGGGVKSLAKDDSYVQKAKSSFYNDGFGGVGSTMPSSKPQIVDSSLMQRVNSQGGEGEKLSLIKLASLIEVSSKKGARDLNLQNKLMEQIEWLPDSIGKLSGLLTLDLSENRLITLPATIHGLSSLTKLDLHSNRISELPQSIGDLLSLISFDLRGNQLKSLPSTFGKLIRLEELDLSSNYISVLPETLGMLVSLKILNIETNDIDEIPHNIGQCTSLMEIRADYNRLKALPEAVGRIETLEVLSVRYNNIKQLPTTMSSLVKLRELDVSFNELESVPESLCFATSLIKMNIGNNFADMRYLPRSIGNLEILEELDISNNQIRFLPDSFRMLTNLRVLRVEENPLEVPPRYIAEKGAQAVVIYMEELVSKRNVPALPIKKKNIWGQFCSYCVSNKRKRSGVDDVTA